VHSWEVIRWNLAFLCKRVPNSLPLVSSLSYRTPLHNLPAYFWRLILISHSHRLNLGFPNSLIPSGSPTKILHALLFFPMRVPWSHQLSNNSCTRSSPIRSCDVLIFNFYKILIFCIYLYIFICFLLCIIIFLQNINILYLFIYFYLFSVMHNNIFTKY